MKYWSKIGKLLTCVVTASLLGVAGCTQKTEYVATMGDIKISASTYKYFLLMTRDNIEMQVGVTPDQRADFWSQDLGEKTAEQMAREMAMDACKEYNALLVRAKSAGTQADQALIDNIVTQTKGNYDNLGNTTAAKNRAFLEGYGMSFKEFEDMSKDLALVQTFSENIFNEIAATDDEVKSYYDENSERYDLVTVKHILFRTTNDNNEDLSEEEKQEKYTLAQEMVDRIKAGEDMAELAAEYTEDPGSVSTGGEYTFGRGEMVPEFEEWSYSANIGDIDIVETSFGYHVMRLEKHSEYDDVKETAKSDLTQKKFADQLAAWIAEYDSTFSVDQSVLDKIKFY